MYLFLTYDLEDEGRQKLEGIIRWPSLGEARTRVVGSIEKGRYTLEEVSCLTNCQQVVTGGQYMGNINLNTGTLEGNAELSSRGLKGSFELKLGQSAASR